MFTKKNENYLRLCSSGDLQAVKESFHSLTKEEIESIKDIHKASCLHYAARSGSIEILDYLINQKDVSPLLVSEVGATILHDAAVKGRINFIEWIIKNTDLNLSVKDTNGALIIHLAAKFDQSDLIEWIIKTEGIKSIKQQTYNGATCLHFACATNSFNSLRKILQTAPSLINVQMMNGVTPVYLAVQEKNLTILKYLAKFGANIYLKATDGMSCIHVACQNGNLEMVQYLVEEFRVNLNDKDFNGATPLHYACINGNSSLVAFLLSNGAKIIADKFGNTPLHDCAVGAFIDCARLLIANDCDASLRDNENMTCVDIAESYGHMEFAKEITKFVKLSLARKQLKEQNETNNQIVEEQDQNLNKTAIDDPITKNVINSGTIRRASTLSKKELNNLNPKRNTSLDQEISQESNIKLNNSSTESITSPIFNTLSAANTSTPSTMDQIVENNNLSELSIGKEKESQSESESEKNVKTIIKAINNQEPNKETQKSLPRLKSKQDLSEQQANSNEIKTEYESVSQNQHFIKIIRSEEDNSSKYLKHSESRISAIVELDKCIAEFEKYNDLSDLAEKASVNKFSETTDPTLESIYSNSNNTLEREKTNQTTSSSSSSSSLKSSSAESSNSHYEGNRASLNSKISSTIEKLNINQIRMKPTLENNEKRYSSPDPVIDYDMTVSSIINSPIETITTGTHSNHKISNYQLTLPNRSFQISSQPPPPPPPIPTTWSLNEKSSTTKSFLKSAKENSNEAFKANENTLFNSKKPFKNSSNFIDELQNQIRNGGLVILRNKQQNIDNVISNEEKNLVKNDDNQNKPILFESNDNKINENKRSSKSLLSEKSITMSGTESSIGISISRSISNDSNNNEIVKHNKNRLSLSNSYEIQNLSLNETSDTLNCESIKLLTQQRLSKQAELDMPEWKRKLIEKKRQSKNDANNNEVRLPVKL